MRPPFLDNCTMAEDTNLLKPGHCIFSSNFAGLRVVSEHAARAFITYGASNSKDLGQHIWGSSHWMPGQHHVSVRMQNVLLFQDSPSLIKFCLQ